MFLLIIFNVLITTHAFTLYNTNQIHLNLARSPFSVERKTLLSASTSSSIPTNSTTTTTTTTTTNIRDKIQNGGVASAAAIATAAVNSAVSMKELTPGALDKVRNANGIANAIGAGATGVAVADLSAAETTIATASSMDPEADWGMGLKGMG
jgi:hypothetical protein